MDLKVTDVKLLFCCFAVFFAAGLRLLRLQEVKNRCYELTFFFFFSSPKILMFGWKPKEYLKLVLGGIPVHTEYRCGIFNIPVYLITQHLERCATLFKTGPFQCYASKHARCDRGANIS